MIVVIPRSWPLSKGGAARDYDPEWLPRCCPACAEVAVIGHGRRSKQAHDAQHTIIRIRRGWCKQCHVTITVLPAWSLPYTRYSLAARAQAAEHYLRERIPIQQAAPVVQDGDRVADASTLRRWFWRRIESGWNCLRSAVLFLPTILAWDWRAAGRILIPEANPA